MKKKLVYLLLIVFALTNVNNVDAAKKNKEYKEDRVIVTLKTKYNNNTKKQIENVLKTKVSKYKKLNNGKKNTYVVYTKKNVSEFSKKISSLNKNKNVLKASPSYVYRITPNSRKKASRATANDWHIKQTKTDELFSNINNSNKVKVGVLDSGIDYDHPAFAQTLDKNLSYNFIGKNKDASDDIGHGTHVSGLIAADNKFSAGKNTQVVALRVINDDDESYTEDIIAAINHAKKNKIKILNMSFGGNGYDYELFDAISNYDGIVVAAAGNEDSENINYPAAYELENIINVGALDKSGNKASFSNYNKDKIDIFAPGQDIFSTCSVSLPYCYETQQDQHDEDNIVSKMNGTSMSAPIVSGIAATIYSENPNMNIMDLKNALIDGTTKTESLESYAKTQGYINSMSVLKYSKQSKSDANHYAKLNEDGTLTLWGSNAAGQLGSGNNIDLIETGAFNYKIKNDNIKKYYLTKNNTYVVTQKGDLYVTGANNFNQLNSYNKSSTNRFMKFNKVSNNNIITSLSFRNAKGLYDSNSLKVYLKDKSFYKLGNDSFTIDSDKLSNTSGLQHITVKKDMLEKITFYQPFSNKVAGYEKYSIYQEVDDGEIYIFTTSSTVRKNYANYYTIKNDQFFEEKITTYKKNYNNSYLDKNIRYYTTEYAYNYSTSEDMDVKKPLINDKYYFKNGKKSKIVRDIYNPTGELKSNGYGYASRQINNYYNNGKNSTIYKTNYNSKGKLNKNNLIYKATYNKKNNIVWKNKYNQKMQRTKAEKIIYTKKGKRTKYQVTNYRNKLKVNYLNRTYSKGIKSKDLYYKYNNKGTLKTVGKSKAYQYVKSYKKGKLVRNYRYTYNTKGKKTNKVIIYKKGGK